MLKSNIVTLLWDVQTPSQSNFGKCPQMYR